MESKTRDNSKWEWKPEIHPRARLSTSFEANFPGSWTVANDQLDESTTIDSMESIGLQALETHFGNMAILSFVVVHKIRTKQEARILYI